MRRSVIFSFMVMFILVSAIPAHAEDGAALKVVAKTQNKKPLNKTKKTADQFYPFVVPLSSESFHGLTPSEAAEKELKRTSSGAISE